MPLIVPITLFGYLSRRYGIEYLEPFEQNGVFRGAWRHWQVLCGTEYVAKAVRPGRRIGMGTDARSENNSVILTEVPRNRGRRAVRLAA